jgi:hypothetical protein
LEARKAKIKDLQNKVNRLKIRSNNLILNFRRTTVVKNVTLGADDADLITLDLKDPNMVFSKELLQRFENLLEKVVLIHLAVFIHVLV